MISPIAAMRASQLFEGFEEDALRRASDYFQWITVEKGEEAIREGDVSSFALLVVTGEFEICKRRHGEVRTVAVTTRGAVLGELGLITNKPRYATCRALKSSDAGILTRERFDRMRFEEPLLHAMLTSRLCLVLGDRLTQVTDALLELNEQNVIANEAAVRIVGMTSGSAFSG